MQDKLTQNDIRIWGFHRAHDIEVIHNRFCRFVLKIGKNVPTAFLYGELGHLPMYSSLVRKTFFNLQKFSIIMQQHAKINVRINHLKFHIVHILSLFDLPFCPIFPYHFTNQPTFLPYFSYLFTIQLAFLPFK
jgi:hypothetical protein